VPLRLPRPTKWNWWLIAIGLVGLGVRLAYTFTVQYHVHIGGDSFYYHFGANLLADGKGFIQPYDFYQRHIEVQAAEHPPLYIVLLGIESWLGLSSYTDHQVLSCFIGTITIFLIGLTARKLFGNWAGLFAALIVAIYPYFWFNDGAVLSEGTAQMTTALTVLFAYRFWEQRTYKRAVWLGVGMALATLSRAEALLLPVLLLIPLVAVMKQIDWKRKIGLILASGVTMGVVLGPWVGYNMTRFEKPVTVSTGFDVTLLSANCDITYKGEFRGYWAALCVINIPREYTDLTLQAQVYRRLALDYIKAHKRELPMLTLAREGRTWGWYRPYQNVQFDNNIETKPKLWGYPALYMLWILEGASLVGFFVMRRRKIPVVPTLALIVNVVISTGITFGQSRYRSSAEVALVLMGTAGFVGLMGLLRPGRGDTGPEAAALDASGPAQEPVDPARPDLPVSTR
jgi:4-amino-4-deoxy-L-arabinose transferase-like glycosyltransferase